MTFWVECLLTRADRKIAGDKRKTLIIKAALDENFANEKKTEVKR